MSAVDLAHLAQYTGGDSDLEKEILGMFVPSVRGYEQQLAEAMEPLKWQHAAHAMKGVARGVGAFVLADLAEALEQHYPQSENDRQDALKQLQRQISAVEQAIEDHLRD